MIAFDLHPLRPADMRYSSQTSGGASAALAVAPAGDRLVYKLVRTSRLYEQIVQQIEESIVKGDLKPGDQLPAERELAQRFGVSRTAVREAVKALREKGLVEAYSGKGTFITDGTTQAVRQSLDLIVKIGQTEGTNHLAELRAILEPEIAALAAARIQDPELTTMRDAVSVMDASGGGASRHRESTGSNARSSVSSQRRQPGFCSPTSHQQTELPVRKVRAG